MLQGYFLFLSDEILGFSAIDEESRPDVNPQDEARPVNAANNERARGLAGKLQFVIDRH